MYFAVFNAATADFRAVLGLESSFFLLDTFPFSFSLHLKSIKIYNLKDLRVPTFIPFEVDDIKKTKKATKRKRVAQPDSKPNKRKAKKVVDKVNGTLDDFIVADAKVEKPTQENEIWVGAAVKRERPSRCNYAYVLGTLKAVESLKSNTAPFTVNTTCRDLPRAIAGRGKNFHYTDLSEQIRDAIKENGQNIQVRHLSGRTSTLEHKIAMVLAKDALELHLKPEEEIVEEKVVEEKTTVEEETIHEEPVDSLKEEILTAEILIPNGDENKENQVSNLVVGEAEQTFDEVITTTTTTIVTKEVTLETKVDYTVSEKNEGSSSEAMDLDQKSLQEADTPSSSWASRFGIRGLLDVLYAPFKTRKSS
ncbi:unnamed protein product [Mucor hiemalis]